MNRIVDRLVSELSVVWRKRRASKPVHPVDAQPKAAHARTERILRKRVTPKAIAPAKPSLHEIASNM